MIIASIPACAGTTLLVVLVQEIADNRHHMFAELATIENTIMSHAFLYMVVAHISR